MHKDFLNSYFYFTKKERNALIVLVVLVAAFFIAPAIVPSSGAIDIKSDTLLQKQLSGLAAKGRSYRRNSFYPGKYDSIYPESSYSTKYRDRTVGEDDPRARNRGNRNSGAAYSGTSYSGYTSRYDKRRPGAPAEKSGGGYNGYRREYTYSRPVVPAAIYINTADSADLLPLPGIGPVLAGRIIAFRNGLGGFYSVEQVAETYGLQDSVFQRIKETLRLGETEIAALDINAVDINRLKQHPYIKWNLAAVIIEYRNRHGNFKQVNDLLHINIISPEIFHKIAPYLKVVD